MMKDESSDGNKDYINYQTPVYYTCTGIECEAGGVCVRDEKHSDSRVRCRCPLGRGGFFCEKLN
ncbi:pikachurin-like protein [Leptotrombidium deliense]|uniref:Pikachurin-like protein n=1 Tax=Leptotrombidium deliense TaxID=299467 RepID=A0A443ST49_9ACAR|nr:pikachurin-like protein [Leptotrombidium deliense]